MVDPCMPVFCSSGKGDRQSMEQTAIAPPRGSDSPKKAKPRRRRNWLPFWLILPTSPRAARHPGLSRVLHPCPERAATRDGPAGSSWASRTSRSCSDSQALGESAGHTVIFLVGYASLTLTLGFAIALLLNRKSKLSGVYITLLFIPWILADIIAGVVFRLLVLPDYGLFSGILQNPALFPAQRVVGLDRGCGAAVGRRLSLPALAGHDLPDPGRNLARAALHHAAACWPRCKRSRTR